MRCSDSGLFAKLALCFASSVAPYCIAEEIRVPAFTAYLLPNPDSAWVTEQTGITRWNDSSQSVNWYGKFDTTGELNCKVELCLPKGTQSRLKLTIDEEFREATATGIGMDNRVTVDFGSFKIAMAGYKRIQLESLNASKGPIGDIKALILDGAAIEKAHFNLKERRNAASVHLMYPVPKDTDGEAFYCEVTATQDPTTTFSLAIGLIRKDKSGC